MLHSALGTSSGGRRRSRLLLEVLPEGSKRSEEGDSDGPFALADDGGDLPMRETLVPGQDEDFPLAWRQEGYGPCDPAGRFSGLKPIEGILGR